MAWGLDIDTPLRVKSCSYFILNWTLHHANVFVCLYMYTASVMFDYYCREHNRGSMQCHSPKLQKDHSVTKNLLCIQMILILRLWCDAIWCLDLNSQVAIGVKSFSYLSFKLPRAGANLFSCCIIKIPFTRSAEGLFSDMDHGKRHWDCVYCVVLQCGLVCLDISVRYSRMLLGRTLQLSLSPPSHRTPNIGNTKWMLHN